MKLSTDAVLLGVFANVAGARSILDIGTGSGVLALMLAQRCTAEITGIDIDPGSVEDARENFRNSPWKNRLTAVHQRVQEFARETGQKFDRVISNPPYFENSKHSPYISRNRSKHTVLLSFRDLISATVLLLEEKGACSFILPADAEPGFHNTAVHAGLSLHRRMLVFPRISAQANRVLLEYRKGQASGVEQTSLAIRMGDHEFTPEYKAYTRDFYINF